MKERPRSVLTGSSSMKQAINNHKQDKGQYHVPEFLKTGQTAGYYDTSLQLNPYLRTSARPFESRASVVSRPSMPPPVGEMGTNSIKIIGQDQQMIRVSKHLDKLTNQVQEMINNKQSVAQSKFVRTTTPSPEPTKRLENPGTWQDVDHILGGIQTNIQIQNGAQNSLNNRKISTSQKPKKVKEAHIQGQTSESDTAFK